MSSFSLSGPTSDAPLKLPAPPGFGFHYTAVGVVKRHATPGLSPGLHLTEATEDRKTPAAMAEHFSPRESLAQRAVVQAPLALHPQRGDLGEVY